MLVDEESRTPPVGRGPGKSAHLAAKYVEKCRDLTSEAKDLKRSLKEAAQQLADGRKKAKARYETPMNQLEEFATSFGAAAAEINKLILSENVPAAIQFWEEVKDEQVASFNVLKAATKEILSQFKAASKVKQESTTSSGAKRGRR